MNCGRAPITVTIFMRPLQLPLAPVLRGEGRKSVSRGLRAQVRPVALDAGLDQRQELARPGDGAFESRAQGDLRLEAERRFRRGRIAVALARAVPDALLGVLNRRRVAGQ